MFENKKGNIIQIVVIWIFSCFAYFTFGYTIVNSIVKDIFLAEATEGTVMYYLGSFVPIIPILGLLVWGYYIGQDAGIISSGSTE